MSLPSGPMAAAALGVALFLAIERINALREWWKDFSLRRQIRAREKREPWKPEPLERYRDARKRASREER